LLNKYGIGYLIVTKSAIVADEEYRKVMDKNLAHIQITVTTLDDEFYLKRKYEKASLPSERINAILKLQEEGFDVAIRLSPMIEEFMDFDKLNSLGIQKGIVEFLRINSWISKWLHVDESKYTHYEGGYKHLQLAEKARIMSRIRIPELSACEDVDLHYQFLKRRFNPNQEDCCNLRITIKEKENESTEHQD
jgi:DNA repair photolyase